MGNIYKHKILKPGSNEFSSDPFEIIDVVPLKQLEDAQAEIDKMAAIHQSNKTAYRTLQSELEALKQENERLTKKVDQCLTYGLSYDDLRNGEFQEPIPSYTELTQQNAKLKACVEYYADESSWESLTEDTTDCAIVESDCDDDGGRGGKLARATLAALSAESKGDQ